MRLLITKRLVSGILAGAALTGALSAKADYPGAVMALNPVMYYRLNETAKVPNDLAANLGTLGATATGIYRDGAFHPATGALAGRSDTAASFPDVAGNRVRIAYNPGLAVAGPFTVEFWANPAALASGDSATMCPVSFTQFDDPPGSSDGSRFGWLFYQNGGSGWTFRTYGAGNAGFNATANQTVTAGQWYHIVGVWDGTNSVLYVNGQPAATAAAPTFVPVPNGIIPMAIGARADGQRGYFRYYGSVDEMAYYPAILSAAEILAHYQNGTSSSPATAYDQLVLAKQPAAYYRLNEAAWSDPGTYPTAQNSGSLTTLADGTFALGVVSGVPGVPFSGFGVNNYAAQFNAFSGAITIPPQEISTDTLTITCWVKRWGLQNYGGLVFQRDNNNAFATGLQVWDQYNNDLRGNWSDGDYGLKTGLVPPDDAWVFAAMVVTPTNTVLYLDDRSVSLAEVNRGALSHAAHSFNIGQILIGQDPCCTPARVLNGAIDEVAVFGAALTTEQLRTLFYAGNVPPTILTQPQAVNNVLAGAPVDLKVVASGSPTLGYQWTRNGTNLVGKTAATLPFAAVVPADAGNYAVIITNSYGTVTSVVANISVTVVPAVLSRAVGFPAYNTSTHAASLTQVILEFSAPVSLTAVDNLSNYLISDGASQLNVTGAALTNNNATVILSTSAQSQGALYTVTVTNLLDGLGSPIVSPNNTTQFRAWVSGPLNGVSVEIFDGSGGIGISNLLQNPDYPNQPAMVTNVWGFDSRIYYPDDTHASYGARLTAIFTPPASGNWIFYMRADDEAQLSVNVNGPTPDSKTVLIWVPSCCQDWTAYQSAAIPMVAGRSYYVEVLHKEGGGGDFVKLAARLQGTGNPTPGTSTAVIDPESLNGPIVGYPYAPADVGGAVTLLSGPTNLTVVANHLATFTASAVAPVGQRVGYQWYRGGSAIPGATGATYSFIATTGTAGQYQVQVSTVGSVVTSPAATLTVTADTQPPSVAAVRGSTSLKSVVVSFAGVVSSSQAQNTANYTVAGFTTIAATLDATGTNVTVMLNSPLAQGQTYNITVQNVTNPSGVAMGSVVVPFRTFVFSRGLLQWEYFGGIGLFESGNIIENVLNDPRFPNQPDAFAFLNSFNSREIFPDDTHDCYGSRVTGLFIPPTNGNYFLYIKSDDNSLLYFNPADSDPSGKTEVIRETGCCHAFSLMAAGAFTLIGGQPYYIEAVHREGNGGDYLQVAQQIENGPTPVDALQPMSPAVVGILADPVGASVTITQQPASTLAVYKGADTPLDVLVADFNANNGGFSMVMYGTPKSELTPWTYDAARGSWFCSGSNACFGPVGCGLNSPAITMASDGGLGLTFNHRFSFEGFNPGDGTAWDGGQVRVSVNGGPFTTVPAANFTSNGYITSIGGTIVDNIRTNAGFVNLAWVGESTNYSDSAYLTSVAALGYFKKGDTIVVQFVASWDDCSEGNEPNWEIDRVRVSFGAAVPALASLSVGAESVYQGRPNPYMSYFWQRDAGSGFVDIAGANSAVLALSLGLADSGMKYRCIVYGPGASSTSEAATVSVTVELKVTRLSANALRLSWPLPSPLPLGTFVLEWSPTMAPGSWTTVPTSDYHTTETSVYYDTTVSASNGAVFYRLRRM